MNLSPAVAEREGTCPESLNAMAQPVGLSHQLEAALQMHMILVVSWCMALMCFLYLHASQPFDIISA